MSARPPSDVAEERNWDSRAQQFHGEAAPIATLSDGVICFTGLIAAAVSLHHKLLLVDEPEAFLHPPLARLLGSSLATLCAERNANLITATHSAELLMGCIESGVDTTIVRVTYEDGQGGARVLTPSDLKGLIRDPLLRSTRALQALFHRGIVVGESDHDRAFYEEINRRLRAAGRGAPDTYFANAQNWQTIPRVIGPLRKLGVPAAATIDLDTLAAPKREWNKFYAVMGLDGPEQERFEAARTRVRTYLKALGKDGNGLKCKKTGLKRLRPGERQEAKDLIERLAAHGVFVVPVGELEQWLPTLGVPAGNKAKWIVEMFAKLGSSPAAAGYVHPGRGNVWTFIDRVGRWIGDPARKGC